MNVFIRRKIKKFPYNSKIYLYLMVIIAIRHYPMFGAD